MSDALPQPEAALRGRTVAVAESRELEVFASLLERRGARVLRYPLVTILDAPDPAPVLDWLRRFAAGSCDDLILLTGEGLRRLRGCLLRHAPALEPAFLGALGAVRRITRGPKPARVLRELGLQSDLEAETPTTAGVIATLARHDLGGRRVGVQLYGSEPGHELLHFLESAGARPLPVAPYVYADAIDDARVRELLQRMRSGEVDAIAFTSKAQVERLFRAAPAAAVTAALRMVEVAAVGPVVAATLERLGVPAAAMPQRSWFMKPLAAELAALLGRPQE
jgi:uroporphyrinogen-III synthase